MALQSLDIVRRSATTTPSPSVRESHTGTVAKLIDVTKCIGCKACQTACMEWNDLRDEIGRNVGVYENPPDLSDQSWTLMRFAEYENPKGDLEWLIRKDGCMHCADPGCLKACPAPGAIVQYANGIVDFHEEHCIGCGYCIAGCPFDIPRISKRDKKAYKCTLCSDRVAVGLEPACIKACPTGALVFGTKEDMQAHAAERIEDLKSRGFDQAGLYDPAGVGGTHVMYVLHHADQPQLYNGLPADPHISAMVGFWKGAAKPISLALMLLTALAGFFHYIGIGRNETDERDEHAASASGRIPMDDADRGDSIVRYTAGERINHWIVAITFVLLALSGLALFHPSLFWLTHLLGGGTWTRILHPIIGLLMAIAFLFMLVRFWKENTMQDRDWAWLRHMKDVVNNREDRLPEVGRYNAGQKLLFFVLVACMLGLLLSGLVIWRAYFSRYFPIGTIRLASLAHAAFAFVLICAIIVHVYAAIWVKGSVRAMTQGTVTPGWAWKHHRAWFREVTKQRGSC